MDEPTLQESISQLLTTVPAPIRDYVLNDLTNEVRSLMDKYQLHVDQGGVLQTELLLMLLGQVEPADFMKTLRGAGIGEGTVQSIMVDVNEEVFKPLRKKEIEAADAPQAVPAAPQPVAQPAAPAPQPVAPPPPPVPAPMPAPDRGVRTMEEDMKAAQTQPQYAPGAQTQTYWVPVSITAVPQPYMTTQPPPQYAPQPAAPPPPPPVPAPEPMRAPEPPPPPPVPAPQERVWGPPPPPDLPIMEQPSSPIRKEYAADPYREPI